MSAATLFAIPAVSYQLLYVCQINFELRQGMAVCRIILHVV